MRYGNGCGESKNGTSKIGVTNDFPSIHRLCPYRLYGAPSQAPCLVRGWSSFDRSLRIQPAFGLRNNRDATGLETASEIYRTLRLPRSYPTKKRKRDGWLSGQVIGHTLPEDNQPLWGVLPRVVTTRCQCRLGYTLIVELAEKQLRGKITDLRLG